MTNESFRFTIPEGRDLPDVLRVVFEAGRRKLGREPKTHVRFRYTGDDGKLRYHELFFN